MRICGMPSGKTNRSNEMSPFSIEGAIEGQSDENRIGGTQDR